MSHRKQIDPRSTESAEVLYMNKAAQICKIVSPRNLYAEAGRGSSKSTDFLTERLVDMLFEMPGAPIAWVSDTFTNLTQNVIPTVLESLERKGYHEGLHFVIEKEPPSYNEREKEDLPGWLKPHFWKTRNKIISFKRTIIFFTGLNVTFGSLDRPSTLAGRSFVHIIGDEAKYFKESKIATMMKAVRGYPEYASSPYYMGVTFTSDVADPSHIGEYDWMAKYAKSMNIESIVLLMQAGLIYHEQMRNYLALKDTWMRTGLERDRERCLRSLQVANRWLKRWKLLRMLDENRNFYIRVSSYVNVDLLTAEWFQQAIDGKVPDLNTAILSMRAGVSSGNRFYAALDERHFYYDGADESAYERFGLRDREDCRILRYLDTDKPLLVGVDFGNMCSMSIAQDGRHQRRDCVRILKFLYTLAPDYIDELGEMFRRWFAPMKRKVVYLYYDRSGNAYTKVGRSQVGDLKRAIETDGKTGRPSGWNVHLMSIGQGNIGHAYEYDFMLKLLSGDNPRLPVVLIDYYACKMLRLSLQNARTKSKNGIITKDKSSEKLPIEQLPEKSTNPSDSFKYLLMTKDRLAVASGKAGVSAGNLDPIVNG